MRLETGDAPCDQLRGMRISGSMTVSAAERFLDALERDAIDEVKLPTRGRHHAAGGEGAFVQALTTWAARTPAPRLASYAEGEHDETQLDRLTRRLYGLVGCLLANSITGLRGDDLTAPLQRRALARLAELQSEDPAGASRGPQLEVVCVDHMARSDPESLYVRDEQGVAVVKDLPAFNKIADRLLATVIPHDMRGGVDPDLPPAIGGALHELFRNTEEHARSDDRGNVPAKSVRGFQARRHAIEPEALAALSVQSPPLHEYCRSLRPARADNRDVQLIEISVFDSGPGMAASLSGRPLAEMSPNEERDIVASCFRERVSRKKLSTAGLGLPIVVDLLRERKGFLRLRTGRASLYSDLRLGGDEDFGSAPRLLDWFDGRPAVPAAVGTLFTLLFPLEV